MFRYTYRLFVALVMTVSMFACTDEQAWDVSVVPDAPGTVTLHLEASEISRSAASDNSENRIRSLVVGLYPANADESAPAVAWNSVEYPTAIYGNASVAIKLTDNLISTLFNNTDGAECRFYVIANAPENVPENASIEALSNFAVTAPFASQKVQDSFVMTAVGSVKYSKPASATEQGKASGNGKLYRAAAKVRLNLQIPSEIVINDKEGNVKERWTPVDNQDAIRVLINNGVGASIAEPIPSVDGTPWKPADESAYFNSDLANTESVRSLSRQGTGNYPYIMDVPLYTFPNAWEETAEETTKTTLTLILPWHREGEPAGQSTVFYYQVPVTPAGVSNIARNYSYTINLKVGMLGSLAEDEPMLIDDVSYQIVNWASEDIEVSLNNIRYLVVNPNVYYINNESSFMIPFYTSHDAEISNIEMEYQRFNFPSNNTGGVVDITIPNDIIDLSVRNNPPANEPKKICDYEIVTKDGQKYISINHPMTMWVPVDNTGQEVSLTRAGNINNLSAVTDRIVRYVYPTELSQTPQTAYFPYKFHITVRHIDEHAFSEEVTVTQYPGMYIVDEFNPGGTYYAYNVSSYWIDWDDPEPTDRNYGYVYINPQAINYYGQTAWRNASYTLYPESGDLVKKEPPLTEEKFIDFVSSWMGGMRNYVSPNTGDANDTTNVNNYNMYVLNLTQLSSSDVDPTTGTPYKIADPRTKFVNNSLYDEALAESTAQAGSWCHEADALYDNASKRTLKYYYPTDESSESQFMIAPKLRISSAYGFVQSQQYLCTMSLCRRRAATYQEREFPAGRWRLPTYGEVSFICRLSAQKKIPVLFKIGQTYMTAQGPYEIQSNGKLVKSQIVFNGISWSNISRAWGFTSGNKGCNVRPVYDEWYWEEVGQNAISDNRGGWVYTLGDMPVEHNY